jgi:hypothetical protein
VFEKVLPSIRKTGSYTVEKKKKPVDLETQQSVEAHTGLMGEGHRLGFKSPMHYINYTLNEYAVLFKDRKIRKAMMSKNQKRQLMIMETIEMMELEQIDAGVLTISEVTHHIDNKPALLAPIFDRMQFLA